MLPILEINGLSKSHPSSDGAFRFEVDRLSVFPGQMVGLTGPSGCGKSTLLELAALISRPDASARFVLRPGAEHDIADLWQRNDLDGLTALRRHHMGFVHQAGNLYPFLTVRENILVPYKLKYGNDARGETRARELAEFLGILPLLGRRPGTLSFGERQRVAIARALVHGPSLVLADEPTSALDPETARQVTRLFAEGAGRTGTALIMVSHDHALLEQAHIPVLEIRRKEARGEGGGPRFRWALSGSGPRRPPERAAPVPAPKPGAGAARPSALVASMAWRDFAHETLFSLCGVLAFAAALTPLLLLSGLRYGMVHTLSFRLLNNPNALSIQPYGSSRYSGEQLARLARHPSVSFLTPTTRMLASSVSLTGSGGKKITADLVPTARGDPLLAHFGLSSPANGIILTRQLTRSLPDIREGDPLELTITRRDNGRFENVSVSLPVRGILPDAADWKAHIYAPLDITEAVELYRDGYAVPSLGWPGKEERPVRSYAGFRMYVKTLDDVVRMRDFLMERGVEAYTFAREVENIRDLRRALFFASVLIGGATCAGLALSLASLAISNVQRKEQFFAQAGLMGFSSGALLLFPLAQMTLRAVGAASVSLVLYRMAASAFDIACAAHLSPGESICRLLPSHVLALYAGALLISLVCCFGAGRRLLRLQPAEVLRRHV